MTEPFLAEIRMVGFNYAPRGWAFCDGQLLPINQNQSLYSLLGTTYGGDGRTSFALPDLRGRVPIHVGSSGGPHHDLGEKAGEETHTLSSAEMPVHTHPLEASSDEDGGTSPAGNVLARAPQALYAAPPPDTSLQQESITPVGGGQAHQNMQPYLAVRFCIALKGLFPSRN